MNTTDNLAFNTEVVHALAGLAEKVGDVVRQQRRCCVTCVYFNHNSEGCTKADNQRPPARVIAYGCPAWEVDDIPF